MRADTPLAFFAATTIACSANAASPVQHTHDIQPTTPTPNQYFGSSIATNGTIIAARERETDTLPAQLLFFDAATGDSIDTLEPPSAVPQSGFGASVAFDGDLMAVGVVIEETDGVETRSVSLYDANTRTLIRTFTPEEDLEGDRFGGPIRISGNLLVVGAVGNNSHSTVMGSVFIFDLTTGAQLARLRPFDGGFADFYGSAIAIEGDRLAIGSARHNINGYDSSGAVYVYDTTTFSLITKLIPETPTGNQYFGSSIDIEGGILAIGAPGPYFASNIDDMSVYLYDAQSLEQEARLYPVVENPNFFTLIRGFGGCVQLDQGRLYIGADTDNNAGATKGAIYMFDAATRAYMGKFFGTDRQISFGHAFACENGTVAVGVDCDSTFENYAGSIQVYVAGPCNAADLADPLGLLNIDDLDTFVTAFLGGDLLADCDGSGTINVDDIDCFVASFVAGCG